MRGELVRWIIPILILLGGLGGYFLLVAFKVEPPRDDGGRNATEVVEVFAIVAHQQGIDIRVSGLVVPYRQIAVPAQVAGRIASKAEICRAGRYVVAGTQLMQIDRQDYEIAKDEAFGALAELSAEIANTQSLLKIAQEQHRLQERDYERESGLVGVLSAQQLDQAKRELLSAENALVTRQNELALQETRRQRLEAVLRRTILDLERTTVTTPISGVIVDVKLEQDDFVQRGATVVLMEDTSKVEVRCNLRKEDLQWLWLSQQLHLSNQDRMQVSERPDPAMDYEVPQAEADVFYELGGTRFRWQGRLARYDGIGLDSKTRTIPCRVVVDEPRNMSRDVTSSTGDPAGPPALLRGMYVSVEIRANPQLPLWRVPVSAVHPGRVIWLVRGNNSDDWRNSEAEMKVRRMQLAKCNVRIVQTLEEEVVVHVSDGQLSDEDFVVVSPLSYPRDGLEVRVR